MSENTASVDKNGENYKGIILLARPNDTGTNPPKANQTAKGKDSKKGIPFLPSGNIREHSVGLPPNKESMNSNMVARLMLKERRKFAAENNVVTKHKQYIKELQRQKQGEKLKKLEKEMESYKQKSEFQQTQQQLRQLLKKENYSNKEIKNLMSNSKAKSKTLKKLMKKDKNETKKERPKWSIPKKKLEDEIDDLDGEVEDLLDFANTLDFEEYIDDFEVREALGVIHSRIKELETEEKSLQSEKNKQVREEKIKEIARERAKAQAMLEFGKPEIFESKMQLKKAKHETDWNSSTRVDNEYTLNDIPRGTNILDDSTYGDTEVNEEKIRKIDPEEYSRKEKLLDTMMEELHKERARVAKVITHTKNHHSNPQTSLSDKPKGFKNDGKSKRLLLEMRKDPNYVQNLPYLYRCPSI